MSHCRVRSPLLPATKPINDVSVLVGALTVFIVSLVWFIAWNVRRRIAEPNVDDYLYAIVARQIWAPLANGDVWATAKTILGTGQNAPLVPLLASPLSTFGPDVAVMVQLPLLLALAVLVFSIVRRVSGTAAGVFAALVTSLSAPILNWSLMLHMALASSVCSLGVLDAFLRSYGFTHRRATVGVGIWIGLLAVSRSMAPVYVAMICVTVALSTVLFHRRDVIDSLPRIALASVAAICIAGPWYAVSGLTTLRYLSQTGYGSSSGFVENVSSLIVRYRTTTGEVGYGLAATIAAMCVFILIERRRRLAERRLDDRSRESQFVLLVFAALVMAFLSTSRTPGTAFDLPAIAALVPGLFVSLRERSSLVLIAPFAFASIGLALVQSWLLPGWETRASASRPPAYATGGASALGAYGVPVPRIADRINSIVGDRSVFVTRDDPILNVNALTYLKLARGFGGSVTAPSYRPDRDQIHRACRP